MSDRPSGTAIFSLPQCPYRLWGPANLLREGGGSFHLRNTKPRCDAKVSPPY